jgi:hypothetical protein
MGARQSQLVADSDLKWHDVGQIDPVKAILIMNE